MLLLLLAACGPKIAPMYAAEKALALADPPPLTERWRPDLQIAIGEAPLERAALAAIDAGLESLDLVLQATVLGGEVSIRPSARVKSVDLRVLPDCEGCLSARAELTGQLKWALGPLNGTLPFAAGLGGQPRIQLARHDAGWSVSMRLQSLDRVSVQVASLRELDVGPLLQGWVKRGLEKAPPIALGDIGAEGLPLRAMRLGGGPGALQLEALTDVPSPGALPVSHGAPEGEADWEVRVAEQTVLSMARREAFKAGPQQLGLAVDPRALRFSGGDFDLDLRLWHLSGLGWWRDYTIHGELVMRGEDLVLRGTGADEGEHSPGAALANPLVALADGLLLDTVTKQLEQTLPTSQKADAGGFVLDAAATRAWGEAGALHLGGRFDLLRSDKRR